MSTSFLPFTSKSIEGLIREKLTGKKIDIRTVSPDMESVLAYIINKCISKNPSERFGSAEEILNVLVERIMTTMSNGITKIMWLPVQRQLPYVQEF